MVKSRLIYTVMSVDFRYTQRPWFGPRARARSYLAKRKLLISHWDAMSVFREILGADFDNVEFVYFMDFTDSQKNFHYTIACIYANANGGLRDRLYDEAATFVLRTGWYPLVQGCWMNSVRNLGDLGNDYHKAARLALSATRLVSITCAGNEEQGCAFRVDCEQSSILLDAGFPGLAFDANDCAILLSHDHQDHSGSAFSPPAPIPVFCSLATAAILEAKRPGLTSRIRDRSRLLAPYRWTELSDEISIKSFRVPHCPGAIGFEVSDGIRSILYSGDISLRSDRHDFTPAFVRLVELARGASRTVMLDATMAGRSDGASTVNASKEVLDASADATDIVITSQASEHLVYAYIDLFEYIRAHDRHSTEYFVDPTLRKTFELIHAAYISRNFETMDPYLSTYGSNVTGWAESRWLYWTDQLSADNASSRRRIWFVPHESLADVWHRGKPALVNVGRSAPTHVPWSDFINVVVDVSSWTLHSDEASLAAAVSRLSNVARVVLFHNFPKRLRNFIARFGLSAEVMSREAPILL